MPEASLIEVRDVRKAYRGAGRATVTAVDGVTFEVARGEVLGLLGPNGAGKTTTIKMACGLVHPDSGSVRVAGHDTRTDRLRAVRHVAAVLEGNRNLYWRLSVLENLVYFAGNRGRSPRETRRRAAELLERFGLSGKRDEVVAKLSRGMQQKLAIAVALLADTDVVVLDEPTLGLDVETGHEVRALLRDVAAEGRTVVLSTHDMPVVEELCRRVVVVSGGRVVTDALVDDLLNLFRSRAFRVSLAAPLAAEAAARLRARYTLSASDDTSFEVEFAAPGELYRLMDDLRAAGAEVEGIERTTPRFEEVFRRLVQDGGVATPAPPPLTLKEATVAL
ncbi:MAG TPA: ABC transporter ATP-binding protein [Trueperaceae bacterium]|nr:ABC transporter ATP-binding protein [Trueperaceae bacterium]